MTWTAVNSALLKFFAILGVATALLLFTEAVGAHESTQHSESHHDVTPEPKPVPEQGHHTQAGNHANCHSLGEHSHACAAMGCDDRNLKSSKAGKQVARDTRLRAEAPLSLPFKPPISA
tara:strand:+ start:423 stop:779 length:357 start_codon:yes stop_codon:yes gene_type:complete